MAATAVLLGPVFHVQPAACSYIGLKILDCKQGRIFIFLMGGVRKSLEGVQLFASAWGVGLVGADRSKLERKKLCIIEKLLNYLKYIRVAKILAINSIFGGGVEKIFGGVQNHSGGGVRPSLIANFA